MARGATISFGGLARMQRRVAELTGPQLARVKTRTLSTLARRLPPEVARLASEQLLNLTARQISPYVTAKVNTADDSVTVSASRTRLPLSAFKPSFGPAGAVVTTWRDTGALRLPHGFRRKGNKEVWQRVPFRNQKGAQGPGPSGLTHRLPIVVRKGPSLAYTLTGGRTAGSHGDITPDLMAFSRQALAAELQRLLRYE